MDAIRIMRELELAAYEMAEAERHERAAKALRIKAIQRNAMIHAEIKAAIEAANLMRIASKIPTEHGNPIPDK